MNQQEIDERLLALRIGTIAIKLMNKTTQVYVGAKSLKVLNDMFNEYLEMEPENE